MQNIRKITEDLFYIGCSDRRIQLFESAYPVQNGISYNSYLLKDEKTVFEKEKGTYEYINGTIHYTVQYDSLLNYQTQQFIGYNKKHYYSADGNNTSDKANYTEKAMFSVQKEGKRQWVSKDTYLQQLTDKELDLYFSMDVYKAK